MVDAVHDRIERDARFAADVSHELRTPVTTLTTSLSLLEERPDLLAAAASAVRLMSDELTRFRRALEDLLVLGRLDAGAASASRTAVRVGDLVRQAVLLAEGPRTSWCRSRRTRSMRGSSSTGHRCCAP